MLMKKHEKSFAQVKSYYNEITMNNLALIHNLKKEIEQIKKKEELQDVHIQELNGKISENLEIFESQWILTKLSSWYITAITLVCNGLDTKNDDTSRSDLAYLSFLGSGARFGFCLKNFNERYNFTQTQTLL